MRPPGPAASCACAGGASGVGATGCAGAGVKEYRVGDSREFVDAACDPIRDFGSCAFRNRDRFDQFDRIYCARKFRKLMVRKIIVNLNDGWAGLPYQRNRRIEVFRHYDEHRINEDRNSFDQVFCSLRIDLSWRSDRHIRYEPNSVCAAGYGIIEVFRVSVSADFGSSSHNCHRSACAAFAWALQQIYVAGIIRHTHDLNHNHNHAIGEHLRRGKKNNPRRS